MPHRLKVLAQQAGFRGLFAGLGPRMVMTAGLVSGQFLLYGVVKDGELLLVNCYLLDWDLRFGRSASTERAAWVGDPQGELRGVGETTYRSVTHGTMYVRARCAMDLTTVVLDRCEQRTSRALPGYFGAIEQMHMAALVFVAT